VASPSAFGPAAASWSFCPYKDKNRMRTLDNRLPVASKTGSVLFPIHIKNSCTTYTLKQRFNLSCHVGPFPLWQMRVPRMCYQRICTEIG
jgi:hypothetical protein